MYIFLAGATVHVSAHLAADQLVQPAWQVIPLLRELNKLLICLYARQVAELPPVLGSCLFTFS